MKLVNLIVLASCTTLLYSFGCSPAMEYDGSFPLVSAPLQGGADTSQPETTNDTGITPDTTQPSPDTTDVGPDQLPPECEINDDCADGVCIDGECGPCFAESHCNDNESCTVDSCVNGQCVNESVICPDGFECNELGVCIIREKACVESLDDDNQCTIDVCDPATGQVAHTLKSCDDSNDATDDYCDPTLGCVYVASCWDGDPCTTESFDMQTGACEYIPRCATDDYCDPLSGGCFPGCNENAECADGNVCTVDLCIGGTPTQIGYCDYTAACDDGDPTTYFMCDVSKPEGEQCLEIKTECLDPEPAHDPSCQQAVCTADGTWVLVDLVECEDGTCDGGQCVTKQCTADADCQDNPCATGTCNLVTSQCEYAYDICPNGQICDAATGACYTPIIECTDVPPDYDASCQQLTCVGGEWVTVPTVICQSGTCQSGICVIKVCTADADCQDNPCATGTCDQTSQCVYTFDVCDAAAGEICDAVTGVCYAPPTEPCGGSCDDSNDATLDYCDLVSGECQHHQPTGCAVGTVLDPATGFCVAVQPDFCEVGTQKCLYIAGMTHLANCVENADGDTAWVSYQTCGLDDQWFCALTDPPQCFDTNLP